MSSFFLDRLKDQVDIYFESEKSFKPKEATRNDKYFVIKKKMVLGNIANRISIVARQYNSDPLPIDNYKDYSEALFGVLNDLIIISVNDIFVIIHQQRDAFMEAYLKGNLDPTLKGQQKKDKAAVLQNEAADEFASKNPSIPFIIFFRNLLEHNNDEGKSLTSIESKIKKFNIVSNVQTFGSMIFAAESNNKEMFYKTLCDETYKNCIELVSFQKWPYYANTSENIYKNPSEFFTPYESEKQEYDKKIRISLMISSQIPSFFHKGKDNFNDANNWKLFIKISRNWAISIKMFPFMMTLLNVLHNLKDSHKYIKKPQE